MSSMTSSGTGPTVKQNLLANFAGSGWFALLNIAVTPVYLRLLGRELYGLVGFFAALQTFSLILDRGLGMAANREAARMSAAGAPPLAMRTLLRTLETVYWVTAVAIAGAVAVSAPAIAVHWLRPVQTPSGTVATGLMAMGIVLALQFPFGVYSGILLGLQQHVRYNLVLIGGASVRLLLPIAVLLFAGPNIAVFFLAQAVGAAAQTVAARILVHRSLPRTAERGRFDPGELRRLRGFAGGVTLMTLLSVMVLQLDKLVISHFSTLQVFGLYAIAAAAASGLGVVSLPVYTVVFPRFSQLLALEDDGGVRLLYDRATQVLSALILPLTAAIVVFSRPLLLLWTRDPAVAAAAAAPFLLLSIAVAASSYTYVPLALQLAEGWTSFSVTLNAAGVAILAPAMAVAAIQAGSTGVAAAAAVWQATSAIAMITATDRMILRHSMLRLITRDVLPPAIATLAVAIPAHLLAPRISPSVLVPFILLTIVALFLAAAVATPLTWSWLAEQRRAVQNV